MCYASDKQNKYVVDQRSFKKKAQKETIYTYSQYLILIIIQSSAKIIISITDKYRNVSDESKLSFYLSLLNYSLQEIFLKSASGQKNNSCSINDKKYFSQDQLSDICFIDILFIIVEYKMKENELFSYNFLAIAILAFLNCPDRSDYNLPLSIFAFILWNHKPHIQKHRILWLILASILCDVVWILSVSIGQWNQNTQGNQLRGLTQGLSLVNMCYKIILFIYAVISMEDCNKLFSLQAFRKNVLYFE